MFNFALSFGCNSQRGTSLPPTGSVGLAAFSRDKTLFDSGAAFGRSAATIPLTGTGTAGEIVQARAVSLDDGGATTTAWTDVATISGGGSWSGQITAPRSASWFRPEVRLKAQPAVAAQGVNRFGVGHVIAIWGQSEPERIINAFYNSTTAPTVSDPEAVQILIGAAATPQRVLISDSQPYTAAVAAMASTLIAARPGEKFAVIFHTVPGTDPRELVDDANTNRIWANDKALHDFAVADGAKVGFAAMSWFASPGNLGASYGEALYPLFSGKRLDGSSVTFPTDITYGGSLTYHADHWFGELYNYADTKWVAYGPHRFDIDADMLDATHLIGGAIQSNLANKQSARTSWRQMLTAPTATMFLPAGIEPLTYVNGFDNGAGSWTDIAHPAGGTTDGVQALARMTALAVLEAADLVPWQAPVFDNCLWEATGAYVEVWSSAGAVTTTRIARSEAALPATFPHWTPVMGFQINGVPAQNAQIVAGRVRIFKNGGGNFVSTDSIQYGEGGANGQIQFPEDQQNATWKNLPIVNVGAAGLSGIPIRPLPSSAVLANTLPATTYFTNTAAALAHFRDTVNWPTAASGGNRIHQMLTVAFKGRAVSSGTTQHVCSLEGFPHFTIEVLSNGNLRLTVKDSANVTLINTVTIGSISFGVLFDLIVTIDVATANACYTTLNGTSTQRNFSASTANLSTASRRLRVLGNAAGAGKFQGEVHSFEAWTTYVPGGGRPADDTFLRANGRMVGPAAVANAHPWKQDPGNLFV